MTIVVTSMASLRKYPRSPYWFGCFTLPDGRRLQRSTKQTKRKEAQKLADEWEKLSKEKAGARQAHKVIADIYEAIHGSAMPNSTTRLYLEGWLARRKGEIKPSSMTAYKGRVTHFLKFLGDTAGEPIATLTQDTIQRYRDEIHATRSASTANQAVKRLRIFLEDARREGKVAENVAKDVKALLKGSHSKRNERRGFTVPELKAVLSVADDEWRSMIYFGLYTGQRLADIAQIRWTNLDLTANELRLVTGKLDSTVIIPLCRPLLNHILSLPSSDDPSAPMHPRCISHVKEGGMASALSNQFAKLLAAAGLRAATTHRKSKQGREGQHASNALVFHSLRHTATSLMKNAGISPAVVQDIIGHDSKEMSDNYTHIEHGTKLRALNTLPDLSTL